MDDRRFGLSIVSFFRKNFVVAVAAAAVLFAAGAPAKAIYLSEDGPVAKLRGPIEKDDDKVFAEFLRKARPQPLKVLYLDSEGGALDPAIAIARMVRKAGLATAVEARSVFCDSACTIIFAGGMRRYNVGGDTVQEGFLSFTGLGFHTAHIKGDVTHPSLKSNEGTERMWRLFAEMGMPRAAELTNRAAINTIYRPGGKTTLDMHIATSLGAPDIAARR